MTPRSKLRALDRKKERIVAHAELKRRILAARQDSGLSQDELGERLGISGQQVALRENAESDKNWSGADLLVLFEVLPGLREAVDVHAPAASSSSLEAAVTLLTLRAAEVGAGAFEAKADNVIMPAEAEGLRRLVVKAKRALAVVEATLVGEVTPIRSSR